MLEGMIFAGLDLVREPIDVTVLISILGVFTFLSMENGEYVYIFFCLTKVKLLPGLSVCDFLTLKHNSFSG